MRVVPQRPVNADETVADRYLLERLTGVAGSSGGLLDTITMGEAIIAMERIGQAWHHEDGGLRNVRQTVGIRRLMCIGFQIVTNLDVEFPKLLDKIMANPGKRRGNWGINRAYGHFNEWVMELESSPFATALKELLFGHANRNIVVKTGSALAPENQPQGYQIREAAELAGMSFGKF